MFTNSRIQWRQNQTSNEYSASFLGDCCPRNEGQDIILNNRIDELLQDIIPIIAQSDLRIIQWETPMTEYEEPIPKTGPNLNCSPLSVNLLKKLSIDIALLANNHTGDQGGNAVMETINHLTGAGIRIVGAGENLTVAEKPLLLECKGVKIALLNWAENEFGIATHEKPGAAPLALLRNIQMIKQFSKSVEQVWVTVHGGHEFNPFPSPRMQETYRAFIDAGAKMVFNCHTHCPEGIEIRNGCPIIYSPGNFYFPANYDRNNTWWTGYIPKVIFDREGIYALEVEPYIFSNTRITKLTSQYREEFFKYLTEISAPLHAPTQLQKLFEAWSVRSGVNHFRYLVPDLAMKVPDETTTPEIFKRWLITRDLFTCESHHDMLRQALKLIEENRIASAGSLLPTIEKYQHPIWLNME